MTEKLNLISCYGLLGFFTDERINKEHLPADLYAYEFRSDGGDNYFCTLERSVRVDFSGTFITDVDIDLGAEDYIALSEDEQPNFAYCYAVKLDELPEWFASNPNNDRWETPLSFEVTGLSTAQAFNLRTIIAGAIEAVLNTNAAHVRYVMPQDNLGIVRWSTEDIQRKRLENGNTALPRNALLRAANHVDRCMSDCVMESGWYEIDTAIEEAVSETTE